MTKWIIPADIEKYHNEERFKRDGYIYWEQHKTKYEVEDIVYIYAKIPHQKIKFKTKVEEESYYYPDDVSKSKPYAKLRLIENVDTDELSLENLLKHGLKNAPQGARKVIPELENYIEQFFKDSPNFQEYLNKKGFFFDKETIENYLLSLKVKPFVILTGNSGTGKTKLSQLFVKYLNQEDNCEIVPVGANWTDKRHILGYHNIIKDENQYTPTYDLIKHAENNKTAPHFLILDEMNLSHVERYFADFLSAIESGEQIPLHDEKLNLPKNLFIIGTVNVDETTYMFSPKVLDRANTIEFETSSAKDYMNGELNIEKLSGNIDFLENPLDGCEVQKLGIEQLKEKFSEPLWETLSEELENFQNILREPGFDFGFRVINEIIRFMAVAYQYEEYKEDWDWKRYFDAQIKQKMLPKIHGSQKIIGPTLDKLLEACENYPTSKAKIEEMKQVMDKQRYVSFIN